MKNYRVLTLCAAIVVAACSTGCHSSSSAVVRTVIITEPLSPDCITNAVRNVPGVEQVVPITVTESATWSMYHRFNRELPYENYLYLGAGGTRGLVSVKPQSTKVIGLELSRTWSDHKPTPAEVDDARRIMDDIYNNLFKECDKLPPADSVTENFVNLKEYQQSHGVTTGTAKPSP